MLINLALSPMDFPLFLRFPGPRLQALAMAFTLPGEEMGMGCPQHDMDRVRMPPGIHAGGPGNSLRGWSGGQFPGDLRHVGALDTGDLELVFRRLPVTVGTRQGSRAVRRPAGDFAHVHQFLA